MAGEQCFTLVCLRRLEEDIASLGGVDQVTLSHDRRLLAARTVKRHCYCYSCDNARPAFRLPHCVADEVAQNVWLQLPPEKNVLLHRDILSEYPGVSCLVALQRENAALILCRFFRIETPDAEFVEDDARLAENPSSLEQGNPLLEWPSRGPPEALPPNQIWGYRVPIASIIALFPDVEDALLAEPDDDDGGDGGGQHPGGPAADEAAAAAASGGGGSPAGTQAAAAAAAGTPLCGHVEGGSGGGGGGGISTGEAARASTARSCQRLRIRLCVARPDALVVLIDDVVAMLLLFSWRGISVRHCFFLQRPPFRHRPPSLGAPTRFSDITACQEWIFAVTAPPHIHLLIWHLTGVAFHAIPLGEHLPEKVHLVSLAVALDLLGVAMCDNRHNVWILSLDRYFDSSLKGLDWDLLKERQRCAQDVSVLGQTSKDYQELSVFPEAFGLQTGGERRGMAGARRPGSSTSVMDCLVEGVPTYGIPIPGGAFGLGSQVAHDWLGSGTGMGGATEGDWAAGATGLGADSVATRCIPFAWHERMYQSQEWLDMDRPWATSRGGRLNPNFGFDDFGNNPALQSSYQLNGFSIPAQNKLGDDDLHYSMCIALNKHARRQFQSRLPPWLSKVGLRHRSQPLNPPMLGKVGGGGRAAGGSREDGGSESELEHDSDEQGSSGGGERAEGRHEPDESPSLTALRQELTAAMGSYSSKGSQARPRSRRKVKIGRVELSMTASHVFCEIWEEVPRDEPPPDCPWGLCVICRPSVAQRSNASPHPQVDHLTGSLLEKFNEAPADAAAGPQVVSFRSRRRWRSLVTQSQVWYMLSEGGGLYALMLNQSPVRIISNLLIFESRAKASRLCALNSWNPKQLPVLTLFLGLRFRQLEEIRQSLRVLRPDQEMEACQMIMDFIKAGYSCASLSLPFSPSPTAPLAAVAATGASSQRSPSAAAGGGMAAGGSTEVTSQLPADRSFVSRLLEIAMQFVTKLIQTRVAQIQDCEGACRAITYLQPKHAVSEPPQYATMVHELSQLTVHMQSLRTLQQQLISSFGDEKAYDKGIHICCPPETVAAEQAKAANLKTGMRSLDDAVVLAAKLQASGGSSIKDRAAQMASMRGGEVTEAIVRAALISGRISSALNWFHELASVEENADASAAGCVFKDFRVTAGRLAYQLVCNQQLDFLFVAMHMLRNVGESVNRFFKAVAFHTSKRLVRCRLLRHVDHMGRLTEDDQALISLVNLLEQLYTNPCYTTEFNRMTTRLTTGQYPQRAHGASLPPFYTWPAGGRCMFLVGLSCDGALGGHLNVDTAEGADLAFEQQTSLRELPMSQRMPLELYDMWAGYQMPVMAAMLEMPGEARRAWGLLPCGDIDDLDAQPVLGLSNFHKSSNLEKDQDISSADPRDHEGGEGDGDMVAQAAGAGTWTTCRRCQLEGPKDELDFELGAIGAKAKTDFLQVLCVGEGSPKNFTMGYLHVTLGWMKSWSWDTRVRIIMEKTHFRRCTVESLPFLQPPAEVGFPDQAWRHCWLDFLVAHQDWRGLASWVRCLPLRLGDRVDDHGRSIVDLTHLEDRGLPYCTSYTKEILLQELGRRGIFCQSDVHSFPALLRRLAQCGRLFGDGAQPAVDGGADERVTLPDEGVLPLDKLLPRRRVCPFHRFFIHFCIDHDLPTAMLLYLQKYELATTMDDLKALELQHAEKPWASLLLVGRLGNAHLFAASLQHATTVFHGRREGFGRAAEGLAQLPGGNWRDDASVALMPLDRLATCSPVAFLATLMFAPAASVLDAAMAPPGVPWAVDLGVFYEVVKAYPALHEAFFPLGMPAAAAGGGGGGDGAEAAAAATSPWSSMSLVASVAQANRDRWSRTAGSPPQAGGGGADEEGRPPEEAPQQAGPHTSASIGLQDDSSQQALGGMMTFKKDVSLSTLLSDVAAFDVHAALKPLPIFRTDLAGQTADAAGDKSLASLVALEEQFRDELGEGYFLAQGRAMMAFHVLMTKCMQRAEHPGELKFPLVLSAEDAKRLDKVAKSVAFHNLLNEGVVSSTVCLLELCSLETEMLRVDVQAAKRIYEHHLQQGNRQGNDDSDWPRAAAASVIELFLSFPDVQDTPSRASEAAINSGHLLTALRMLEESTWALDPHPSAPSVSSLQALAYDSPWHLVALFCRVHSLPRSLTLLHELARNNDWVMFLHESDLQQCPADTVLDVVDGYFTDTPLQSHLRILARSIATQEPTACDTAVGAEREEPSQVSSGKLRVELETRQVVDAIGFLERCRARSGGAEVRGTGWGLLQHALGNRTARLAVAASAFSDVSALQCMTAWLTVNTERSRGAAPDASALASPSLTATAPADVAAQIALLCRKSHAFSLVLRALKMFDPESPLVDFVKFHRAFVQCRFQSCRDHLRRFVQRRNAESKAGSQSKEPYCLQLVPYVTQLSEEMVQYLLDGFPRARMMLLSALDQASFSPHYSHLFRSFRLIQQTGLDVDFRMPAWELLQLLISRKMFAEAREWARSSGIVSDTIVFEEVTGMIVEFRQGVWWNVLDERLHLWHKCYDAFLQQSYPPVGAALFFLDITSKLEPDLFAREQLMLLCIAFELMGTREEGASGQEPQSTSQASTPQAPGREQLSRIKLSMLLILTGTNKDLTAELDFSPLDLSYGTLQTLVHRIPEGVAALPLYHHAEPSGSGGAAGAGGAGGGSSSASSLPMWAASGGSSGGGGSTSAASATALVSDQRGPRSELLPYLDTAISSLINCDEISWARQLAEGFDFESADLRLAMALETIASGQLQEALHDYLAGPHLPPIDPGPLEAAQDGDVEQLLRSLSAQCSPGISLFCRRRMVCFSVSRTIGMDYRTVSQIDVGELLDRLLSPQPHLSDIALCRSLLSCYPRPLNKVALAEVLANRFVRSTVGPDGSHREWAEHDLDEFVSLLGSSQEKLGNAALCRIPNFRRASGGNGGGVGEGRPPRGDAREDDKEELPLECEVEVLIMAYHAYVQACSEKCIGELLRFLRARAGIYVEHRQFALLVRLLGAIPEYHAMEYMFGHLVHHGKLDLLLALGRSAKGPAAAPPAPPVAGGGGGGGAATPGLAIALVRYLQDHFPRNLELRVQVHQCFGMDGHLACLLEHEAWKVTQGLGSKWERICSEEGEDRLLTCLSLFLQCSRHYLKAKMYQKHLVANEFAALICVQLKAVQIHLAASLQEQQNAVPRDEAFSIDPHVDWRCAQLMRAAPGGPPPTGPRPLAKDSDPGIEPPPAAAVAATATTSAPAPLSGGTAAAAAAPAPPPAAAAPGAAGSSGGAESGGEGGGGVGGACGEEEAAPPAEQAVATPGAGGAGGEALAAAPDSLDPFGAASATGVGGASGASAAGGTSTVGQVAGKPAPEEGPMLDLGLLPLEPAGSDFLEPPAAAPLEVAPPTSAPPLGPAGDPFVVINLEVVEVEVFAEYHQDFVVAFQVVSAYRHTCDEGLLRVWPRALYRQVVLFGNAAYLHLFMRHLQLTKEYLEAVVRFYKNEACPEQYPQRAKRMKYLLHEGVPNLETRYMLSRQLGSEFADVQNETASLVYMA